MTSPDMQTDDKERDTNPLEIVPSKWKNIAKLWSYSPAKNWHPSWIFLLIIVLTGCGIAAHKSGLLDRLFPSSYNSSPNQCDSLEYEMLRNADTLGDVRDVMNDRGREIKTSGNTSTYDWNIDGESITVNFEDDKIVSYSRNCD